MRKYACFISNIKSKFLKIHQAPIVPADYVALCFGCCFPAHFSDTFRDCMPWKWSVLPNYKKVGTNGVFKKQKQKNTPLQRGKTHSFGGKCWLKDTWKPMGQNFWSVRDSSLECANKSWSGQWPWACAEFTAHLHHTASGRPTSWNIQLFISQLRDACFNAHDYTSPITSKVALGWLFVVFILGFRFGLRER